MTLTSEDLDLIKQAHYACGSRLSDMVRYLREYNGPASKDTVAKYCCMLGLEVTKDTHGGRRVALNGGRGALSAAEQVVVISARALYHSPYEAAKDLPYNASTIKRIWDSNGKHKASTIEEKVL